MEAALKEITNWLLAASSQVHGDYVQVPVAGREKPVYRERVYCYELYHRWRCHWREELGYSLSGEIDKGGHPLIRGKQKPDFLVHVPGGDPPQNLLVVEVKFRNASIKGLVKDVQTMTKFRRDLEGGQNYHAAYLWIYGLAIENWPRMRDEIQESVEQTNQVDLGLIKVLVHAEAGKSAAFMDWNA